MAGPPNDPAGASAARRELEQGLHEVLNRHANNQAVAPLVEQIRAAIASVLWPPDAS